MRNLQFDSIALAMLSPAASWRIARDPLRYLPTPSQYREFLTRLVEDVVTLAAEVHTKQSASEA
jgi:hypothetical protein